MRPRRATLAPQEIRAESSAHAPTGAAASASLGETHSQVRKPSVGVRWRVGGACAGQGRAGASWARWARLQRGSAARPQLGFLARHCMHLTSLASSAIRRTRQMGLGLTEKTFYERC